MQSMLPNWQPSPMPSASPRKRGVGLTLMLVGGMIGNIVSAILLAFGAALVQRIANNTTDLDGAPASSHVPMQMLFVAAVCIANVVFLVGIWSWKRWGVIGYVAASIFSALAGLSFSTGGALGAVVFLLLFGAAIASRWQAFE
jgi:hypothetical protein